MNDDRILSTRGSQATD